MSEQALPVPGGESVTEALITFLRQREAKGIATYGRSLETFNGRSAPRDLKEELIDGLQYAMQWEMEREKLQAQLATSEQERDKIRATLATMMNQADAEEGRNEGSLAAYRMMLHETEAKLETEKKNNAQLRLQLDLCHQAGERLIDGPMERT